MCKIFINCCKITSQVELQFCTKLETSLFQDWSTISWFSSLCVIDSLRIYQSDITGQARLEITLTQVWTKLDSSLKMLELGRKALSPKNTTSLVFCITNEIALSYLYWPATLAESLKKDPEVRSKIFHFLARSSARLGSARKIPSSARLEGFWLELGSSSRFSGSTHP